MPLQNDYEVRGADALLTIHARNGRRFQYTIDAEDLPKVRRHQWHTSTSAHTDDNVYAKTGSGTQGKFLQRLVADTPPDLICCLKDTDQTNCRKSNLLNGTRWEISQHTRARRKGIVPQSGYVGVVWNEKMRQWRAGPPKDTNTFLGYYKTVREALAAQAEHEAGRKGGKQ